MDETLKKQLEITACKVRLGILEGVFNAKSGHPGGSLSIADLLTYLYFAKMNVYPDKPEEPERDRLVLSKGHTAPALYATLAEKGFFPKEELKSLRHIGAMLQGHPCISIPGVDMSSGSLGQGISVACGMALSGKLTSDTYKVYTILGKFAAFGWHVITADAHDFDSLEKAFNEAETVCGQPCVIVMKSIKGKGVSFMENNVSWHGSAPNKEQYEQAVAEINEQLKSLEG